MKKLKVFILMFLAFAGLNIAFKPDSNRMHVLSNFVFFDNNNTVYLKPGDYKLLREDEKFLSLSITNTQKADSIQQLTDPTIEFYFDLHKFKARGIDVVSSAVPQGADYFFPLVHGKNTLLFFKDNNLALSKI
ncbi:hypothetical protein ACFFGT_09255 [Mucilaginibacter angelicae]|uniref:Uncharacterized protein n=1 Tax=Mucilaginibacter angelicae TaxID=869718 RepID=A0ABV6L4M3_9SPHI